MARRTSPKTLTLRKPRRKQRWMDGFSTWKSVLTTPAVGRSSSRFPGSFRYGQH